MPRKAQRTSQRSAPRLARTLACAAVAIPMLLVAGCAANTGGEGGDAAKGGGGGEAGEPVKFKQLPDACKILKKDTVEKLTPKTENASGKRIGTGNLQDSGSCLWTGLDKFDYKQLTVSLKRFDSDSARGSGDKLATAYAAQQTGALKSDKANKGLKTGRVSGLGDQATTVSFNTEKKDGKDTEKFNEERVIVRSANVVVTVDYAGAGFEDGKTPKAEGLKKNAQLAAKEAVAALN